MSNKVWWMVVSGVNCSHLWDGEVFDKRKDALIRYHNLIDPECVQVLRLESKDKYTGAHKTEMLKHRCRA